MQWNRTESLTTNTRSPGLLALAVIGFIALVCLGMYLAIYSARFVPGTVTRIGTAAVSFASLFTGGHSGIAVIPASMASSTIYLR